MKILITGVAGLLGSRLSDYVIKNHLDVEVVGIDDLSGGYCTLIGAWEKSIEDN